MQEDYVERVAVCARALIEARRGEASALGPESPIRDFLDSFHLIKLVTRLEDQFKIRFQQRDLADPSDWHSARSIAALIHRVSERR
jgi:acyl carrier protein